MKKKFIFCLMMFLTLSILQPQTVYCEDQDYNGLIRVSLEEYIDEYDYENISFGLIRLGSLDEQYDEDMTCEQMYEIIQSIEPDYICGLNKDGTAEFRFLKEGTYLLYCNQEDTYFEIEPSLIRIPFYELSSGEMKYQVNVFPKCQKIDVNIENTQTSQNTQTGNTNQSSEDGLTYKGFKVVGKIEIPKTDIEYPLLEKVTPQSIEASIGVLYGPGVNEVGNTVLIGHNFRNGLFFSNNKRLENGDKIYITDMEGNKITYTIYKKYTTDTNDFDYATRDTNGKREISLSTCTDDTKNRLIIWAKED